MTFLGSTIKQQRGARETIDWRVVGRLASLGTQNGPEEANKQTNTLELAPPGLHMHHALGPHVSALESLK